MTTSKRDKKFIQHCIELSKESLAQGNKPFGALVTQHDTIIAQAGNDNKTKIYHHAELMALEKAVEKLKTRDLSSCTLYSNVEPCPMCAFMIREYKIKRVVFSLISPFMGGYTKWPILQDKELGKRINYSTPPIVRSSVLVREAHKILANTPLATEFGKKQKI